MPSTLRIAVDMDRVHEYLTEDESARSFLMRLAQDSRAGGAVVWSEDRAYLGDLIRADDLKPVTPR